MQTARQRLFVAIVGSSLLAGGATHAQVVRSAAGDLAAVTVARDAFRADLGGGTTAGANGSFGGLRREINWDGAPDNVSRPNLLPSDFFNLTSARGAVFFNSHENSFAVSAKTGNPTATPVRFADFDPAYETKFTTFSAQRLFISIWDPAYEVRFFVPGTNRPAVVSGFGAVFTDVDIAGLSAIEYFGIDGQSYGRYEVPAAIGDQTLSFLGVTFPGAPAIARVVVTSGDVAIDGGGEPVGHDAVAADDFLYGEPVEVEDGGCVATPTALCLSAGRFRVEATFTAVQTGSGIARVVPLNSNSGTMTFFSPQVSEVLIKVLDACTLNNRFWVYGAAATDVGYDITVTDTATGDHKVYSKIQGPPAAALTDSDAFATCWAN
ncbi:MAG: hypothetical protein ABIV06_10875 [Thermoanaerobaculia bacterium]